MKAAEVTAGLAESNGSLLPGGWLKVTCGLTACILRDQLRAQRSVTSMGELYLYVGYPSVCSEVYIHSAGWVGVSATARVLASQTEAIVRTGKHGHNIE